MGEQPTVRITKTSLKVSRFDTAHVPVYICEGEGGCLCLVVDRLEHVRKMHPDAKIRYVDDEVGVRGMMARRKQHVELLSVEEVT